MSNFDITISGSNYSLLISSQSKIAGNITVRNTRNNYVPIATFDVFDRNNQYYNKIDLNDDVYIKIDDYNIFKGTVDSKELDWSGVPIIKVTAIGKTNNLFGTRTTVNENFKNKYSHEIAKSLVNTYLSLIHI